MLKPKQFKPQRATGTGKFTPTEKKRSSTQLGYDREWQTYRFRFLHHNPYCYACGHYGQKELHVDHVIPHKGNEILFWKLDNLISLCKVCHGIVTSMFDCKAPPDTEGKLAWINKKRQEMNIIRPSKIVPKK